MMGELLFCSPNGEVLGRLPLMLLDEHTVGFVLDKAQLFSVPLPATFTRARSVGWTYRVCFIVFGAIAINAMKERTNALETNVVGIGVVWFVSERMTRIIVDYSGMSLHGITGARRIPWSDISEIKVVRPQGGSTDRLHRTLRL